VELAAREAKELDASFTKWKTKVAQHETNLKEVDRLKAKCRTMQDEADENLKYKEEASKGFGITQSGLVNLKKSMISGKEQEKKLEQTLKETIAWKHRLKVLQEEHKELSRWKLHVQKNARTSGLDLGKLLSMKPGRYAHLLFTYPLLSKFCTQHSIKPDPKQRFCETPSPVSSLLRRPQTRAQRDPCMASKDRLGRELHQRH